MGNFFTDEHMAVLVAAILTGVLTYWGSSRIFRNTQRLDTVKVRFYLAYLPLFKSLEPHLYCEITHDTQKSLAKTFSEITKEHSELLNPHLFKNLQSFCRDVSVSSVEYERFENICYDIEKEYEDLKKILYLPKRSLLYRYWNKQMPRKAWASAQEVEKTFISVVCYGVLAILIFTIFILLCEFLKLFVQ